MYIKWVSGSRRAQRRWLFYAQSLFLISRRLDLLLLLLLLYAEVSGPPFAASNPQPVGSHIEPSGSYATVFDLPGAFQAFRSVFSERRWLGHLPHP